MSRKFRTVITIDTNNDPRDWSLANFHWAIENDEASVIDRESLPFLKKVHVVCSVCRGPFTMRAPMSLTDDPDKVPAAVRKCQWHRGDLDPSPYDYLE
jgi:hypothetical protein